MRSDFFMPIASATPSLQLGVWLRPTELATLFAAVDEDGGGDVDFEEFERFWLKW